MILGSRAVTSHIRAVCSKPKGTLQKPHWAMSCFPGQTVQAVRLGLAAQVTPVVSLPSKCRQLKNHKGIIFQGAQSEGKHWQMCVNERRTYPWFWQLIPRMKYKSLQPAMQQGLLRNRTIFPFWSKNPSQMSRILHASCTDHHQI